MESYLTLAKYLKAPSPEQREALPDEKLSTTDIVDKFLEDDVTSRHASTLGGNGGEGGGGEERDDSGGESTDMEELMSPGSSAGSKSAKSRKSVTLNLDNLDDGDDGLGDSDDDIETVLDASEGRRSVDHTGQRAYTRACRRFRSIPSASFHRQLAYSTQIDMKHYGAGPKGVKALAIPMLINTKITSLNLKGNDLSRGGMEYIAEMMSDNDYITELDLSDNNLRSSGAKLVAYMMTVNSRITRLDVSGNSFSDSDAAVLLKAFEHHPSLVSLNLSHNNFGEPSGAALRTLIAENELIQELDLSWNHLQSRAAEQIAKGLKENITLRALDVSWNGFGNSGAENMAGALKSCALTTLDLSSARVTDQGFTELIKTLKTEDDLKTLRLCRNPIRDPAACAAMDFLLSLDELNLELLDIGEVILGQTFKNKLEEVLKKHHNFTCRHGYTDSYGKRKLKQYNVVEEALMAMNDYCNENKINIVELFTRFDEDGSMSVTHDEFKQGLKDAKIPLTPLQVEELIKALDQDGDGEIDFSELVLGAETIVNEQQQQAKAEAS